MSEPTKRDREVGELARNSGSRAERDAIIAAYREEILSEVECVQRVYLESHNYTKSGWVVEADDLDALVEKLRKP